MVCAIVSRRIIPNSRRTPTFMGTGLRCRARTRKTTAVVLAVVLQYKVISVVIVPERRDRVKHPTKGFNLQ